MTAGKLRERITFQRKNDSGWEDYITVQAYVNGVSGNEFFIANAGYEAALTVTIDCRFQLALLKITPMRYRAVDHNGIVYELISPGDDIKTAHTDIRFRAKRIYTEEDGEIDQG